MEDAIKSNNAQTAAGSGFAGRDFDPTQNVLQLVQAAVQRLDDIRVADFQRIDALREATAKRVDDLRVADVVHLKEVVELHAQYHEKLALAETKRIDAIRSVDVAAVSVASERATQSAQVLANQVSASADALRTLVATTATTFASQQQNLQTQITERLALLERSQYESKGKESYSDPIMTELVTEMKAMRSSQQMTTGKTEGMSNSWAVLLAVAAIAIGIAGLFYVPGEKKPSIVYLPAPTMPAPTIIEK